MACAHSYIAIVNLHPSYISKSFPGYNMHQKEQITANVNRSNTVNEHNLYCSISYLVSTVKHKLQTMLTQSTEINKCVSPAENRPKHSNADIYKCSVIIVCMIREKNIQNTSLHPHSTPERQVNTIISDIQRTPQERTCTSRISQKNWMQAFSDKQ